MKRLCAARIHELADSNEPAMNENKKAFQKQESIPGCILPACLLYMFQWPPLDVSTIVGVFLQVSRFEQVSSDDQQMSIVGIGPMYPVMKI